MDLLWSSLTILKSVIFGKCSEIFGTFLETFVLPPDKFWKTFEIFGKLLQTSLCIAKIMLYKKENYMVTWRNKIYLRVLKNISQVSTVNE